MIIGEKAKSKLKRIPGIQQYIKNLSIKYPIPPLQQIKPISAEIPTLKTPQSRPPVIALFWDLENIPIPLQTGTRLLEAIHNFIEYKKGAIHKAVVVYRPDKSSPNTINRIKEHLPMLEHCTSDSTERNAVDKALLRCAFETINQNPAINTVYLLTGDQDYHHFVQILKDTQRNPIIICRSTNYGQKFAQGQQMRYMEALIKHPEYWWYTDDHPNSIGSLRRQQAMRIEEIRANARKEEAIKRIEREKYLQEIKVYDDIGKNVLSHTLVPDEIKNLIDEMEQNANKPHIRRVIIYIFFRLFEKYPKGRTRKKLWNLVKDTVPGWVAREQEAGNQELVDLMTQNLTQ